MLKRYSFWFAAAILFQIVTALVHSVSLFVRPQPENPTEEQLFGLATTYRMDMGGGFHPTFYQLFTSLSSCFTFLCLFAAAVNGYLMLKQAPVGIIRGVLAINVTIFGTLFLVMSFLTFLPPIVCTGLIFFNSLAAYLVLLRYETIDN